MTPALTTRLRAYATTHGLTLAKARAQLIAIALDHLDARAAGGRAAHATSTPEARSEAMRQLALRRHHGA